jgi:hypothetical protein
MNGSQGTQSRWGQLADRAQQREARFAVLAMLTPFSTRLPPELLERLRIAAPQLGTRQGEITAPALDFFLSAEGF